MANDLFNRIMGKVPIAAEEPVEKIDEAADEKNNEVLVEEVSETVVEEVSKTVVEETDETVVKKTDETVVEETDETVVEETDETVVKETDETIVEETDEAVVEETGEAVDEEEENSEPPIPANDVQELLNKMLGEVKAGSTKSYVKQEKKVHREQKEDHWHREDNWNREDNEHNESLAEVSPSQVILIDLILDSTISMRLYYKVLYNKLFDLVNGIHKMARKSGFNVEIRYGITYIRDTEPITEENFLPDCFTKDVLQIMEKLKNITFSGGADHGRENINGAIRTSLQKLHAAAHGSAKCGILLFTDSLPEEEEMAPDFTEYGEVRFAHCFVKDDMDYIPAFRVVDHDGKTDSRLVNDTKIRTLEYFLNEDADSITLELISEILEQVSVNRR